MAQIIRFKVTISSLTASRNFEYIENSYTFNTVYNWKKLITFEILTFSVYAKKKPICYLILRLELIYTCICYTEVLHEHLHPNNYEK